MDTPIHDAYLSCSRHSFALSIYTITFANIQQLAETRVLLVLYNRRGDVLTSGPSTFHHNTPRPSGFVPVII
jgi:hypothetical protein